MSDTPSMLTLALSSKHHFAYKAHRCIYKKWIPDAKKARHPLESGLLSLKCFLASQEAILWPSANVHYCLLLKLPFMDLKYLLERLETDLVCILTHPVSSFKDISFIPMAHRGKLVAVC